MKKLVVFMLTLLAASAVFAVVNGGATNRVVAGAATKLTFGQSVDFCYFYNEGTNTIWFAFGENVSSVTNKFPLSPGARVSFEDPSFSFVSYGCLGVATSSVTYGYYGGK